MDIRVDPQIEPPAGILQTWFTRICLAVAFLLVLFLGISTVNEAAIIDGVVFLNRQSRGHDDHVEFHDGELPPVGGIHHSQFQNCGIYVSPISSEKAVHSLEHGAVWITYDPDLSAAEIDYLQDRIRDQDYFLLSPYPGQPSPVILSAWGVQLQVNSVHDERVDQFIARYLLGPRTPERGASCRGGFGSPVP